MDGTGPVRPRTRLDRLRGAKTYSSRAIRVLRAISNWMAA